MKSKLEKRREKIIKKLPGWEEIIRGSIRTVYAPCGKKKCRCKKGFLHGPYYYLAVRTEGKTKMYYLPHPFLGKKAKKAISQYNKLWNILCKISEINIRLLKEEKR